ncbi:hypothetical protein QWJ39_14505 [Arthrobacter sp. YD4]|uniref:hypothetical protein n=1 Tax=Arthrobacter sp. YD4 TaxID=3058043 RepID=UPI0025B56894|nr:hypothetical protein [Arthrobacter sp. YD4]MDN3937517.1 hypothetical protein [Arthrobacter sp. YD4]
MHSLFIALATAPAPSPTPSLRPGLDQDQVSPGLLGFVLTAFIVILSALLIVDMVRRIRRVRYRAQVEEERAAAEGGADKGADVTPGAGTLDGGTLNGGRDGSGPARPEANGDAGPGSR